MIIFQSSQFSSWSCLNDTIMGGSSISSCKATVDGLLFEGNVIEENGGFISCRSQLFDPALNLNKFSGLELHLDGKGKTFKLALSSQDKFFGIKEIVPRGLRWVKTFSTNINGTTILKFPFDLLKPNIRARRINLPIKFNSNHVLRIQLLYSRFGDSGELNYEFCPGPFSTLIRSINAYY